MFNKLLNCSIKKKLTIAVTVLTTGILLSFIASLVTIYVSTAKYKAIIATLGGSDAATTLAAQTQQNILVMLIFIVVIFTISEVMVVKTIKSIRVPIQSLEKSVKEVSEGKVDVEVTHYYDDEVGSLADATKIMVDNMKTQAAAAQKVADGDLTVEIVPRNADDTLNIALKQLVDDNNMALSEMKIAAGQVSDGSDQVAAASQALAQGSTEQASAITEITASIEDIAARTKVNANDATNANNLVSSAKDDAVHGNERMTDMIQAMAEINESSENISKIIKVIDDIAFQTNILALNAAVEAARAGVHGKGFSVVAEEVRNLAGKSSQAASETADLIEDSIRKVGKGSKLAEETAAALKQITDAIDQVADITSSIADASNEQATAVAQIDQAIGQVSIVVQNNSSTSEECAAASEELSAQALKLKEMIGHYTLKDADADNGTYSKKAKKDNKKEEAEKKAPAAMIEKKDDELVISLDDGFGKY